MLMGIDMAACGGLAVPPEVMRHIVQVESGANPYAIGVVGGQLLRQPRQLDEAVATARMLEAKGYNFSLGLAQVNRFNLSKYGLDTPEKAFDACANLSAGSRILAGCHASAEGDWAKAFSCYYSGNFVTGFRHGYVQKIYDSINRGATASKGSAAIPLRPGPPAAFAASAAQARVASKPPQPDKIAMRSVPLNAATHFVPVASVAPVAPIMPAAPSATPPVQPATLPVPAPAVDVFVPQVRGPGEPVANPAAPTVPAAPAMPIAPIAPIERTEPRQDTRDNAFVF